ncbi:diacylglycerol kinase family lipid kinase [Aeromicrobium camelliae]|uniref:Diacylglycerol kinase family lipid kinase n=1 Tax=Aeromicrobium camelliae TaxID=1538144 RepID=A0A3N6WQF6_9ACTN|nr:diacylglycerol kinase family protein [Aeromicrobium camelliae]RQN09746.1 diacylglycerol kinase family lipid kinase [Aeromicrobium camelliae]
MTAFTALLNPISGTGGTSRERWDPVARVLRAAGAEVDEELTVGASQAGQRAEELSRQGRVVVAVGGDGLVRDVAGGVVAGGGTLGIVPAGRGNDLALGLGLPENPDGLARVLLDGSVRRIDVLDADGVVVPGNVYAGVDSHSTRIINRYRRMPPLLLYRLAPVLAVLRWRPTTFELTLDGERVEERLMMLVAANSGRYGHGLHIVPSARLDDGLIHVLTVDGDAPLRRLASFMKEAKTGAHVQRPQVTVRTAGEVTIRAHGPVPFGADGDEIAEHTLTVRCRPRALPVLVDPRFAPESSTEASPGWHIERKSGVYGS